jgi:hypothetical protein
VAPHEALEPVRARRRGRPARARVLMALTIAPAVLGLYACGESKEEKAEKQVCAARSDISAKVTSLKGLTPTVASVPQIKTDVEAIVEDLKKIRDAIPNLTPTRKSEVKGATEEFGKQASEAVEHLKNTGSVTEAETQLHAALTGLVHAYETALAPIKCS